VVGPVSSGSRRSGLADDRRGPGGSLRDVATRAHQSVARPLAFVSLLVAVGMLIAVVVTDWPPATAGDAISAKPLGAGSTRTAAPDPHREVVAEHPLHDAREVGLALEARQSRSNCDLEDDIPSTEGLINRLDDPVIWALNDIEIQAFFGQAL